MNCCSKYVPEALKTTVSARSLIRVAAVSAGTVIIAPLLWGTTPVLAEDVEYVERSSAQTLGPVETEVLDRVRIESPSEATNTVPKWESVETEPDDLQADRSVRDAEVLVLQL